MLFRSEPEQPVEQPAEPEQADAEAVAQAPEHEVVSPGETAEPEPAAQPEPEPQPEEVT